jgi:RNA polymerase sigma-70 factor, ECF subfamily
MESGRVTQLFVRIRRGDESAHRELFECVYDELRAQARRMRGRMRATDTLQTTALVNEVYLKLSGGRFPDVQDAQHFFRVTANAMRQLLIDHARGHEHRARADDFDVELVAQREDGSEVDSALVAQAIDEMERDPKLRVHALIVSLRYFAGRTLEEIAELLELSLSSVKRMWDRARAWLARRLKGLGAS